VIALAKLHNYCIDEIDVDVPPLHVVDELEIEMQGGILLETPPGMGNTTCIPRQLIGGGNHFHDMDLFSRRRRQHNYLSQAEHSHQQLPRDHLHALIADANLRRPAPISRGQDSRPIASSQN
jgi:hypothetical protein